MANELKDTAQEVEMSAAEGALLDGINKIADTVHSELRKHGKRLDEVKDSTDKKIDELESKTNKSLEDVVGRIAKLKDHSSVLGKALRIEPGDDNVKDVIRPETKAIAGHFESICRSMPKESALSDPTVHMAAHDFFVASTRSQLRKFASTAHENASRVDKIYAALQEKHYGSNWEAITKAALQEDTAAEGGNLVPTIVEAEIVRQIKDAGDIWPQARQIAMRTKVHQVPSESTAVTVNWIDEEGALTQGEPTFAQKTLTAEKLAGRAKMSVELIQDSAPGLLNYLLEVFSEKMAGELDKQLVLGDGSGPQITGIMNASGINAITSATAAGRELTYALLVSTFTGASEKSARMNGYWIVSPKGYAELIGLAADAVSAGDGKGQPIVQFGNVPNAPAGTILGRPIIVSARLGGNLTLDDVTNTATKIVFGPLNSLLAGTRAGLTWDVTDQVSWANYQMDARLIGRFAGNVAVPGNFTYLGQVAY